ncbi:stage V sporulation protein AC [Clostridium sp. MSJ-8]|uniref:stage V sporulation protein AC n=1 Tax=Clostridium sp. MSJ-8 TaxID=2841510 RepID=UPI001C0EC4B4|nr:stage V sporulation protein AC [Clostridium sp. MSJ-8]MBU5486587.1 stage V sporulation protein AC [Clostridium sp. MSJ-8]
MNKENIAKQKFQSISDNVKPKTPIFLDSIKAFLVGGFICSIGQLVNNYVQSFDFTKEQVGAITSIVMIFLGALLTGIGIYDRIAEFAGAGTVVPITGFSNSIVSPAMEFKKEGYVFGVASKMFIIAGPVLVYGIGSSVLIGIIYYFIK